MAEKPNKWNRERGMFSNSADLFTIVIAVLCGAIFVVLLLTQWNMAGTVHDFFAQKAASQPPRQPDIASRPGETGVYLYRDQAPEPKKKPPPSPKTPSKP